MDPKKPGDYSAYGSAREAYEKWLAGEYKPTKEALIALLNAYYAEQRASLPQGDPRLD